MCPKVLAADSMKQHLKVLYIEYVENLVAI